ncbi:Fic family protein [Hymenobacter rubripertinctus]|uniref:Fic family protein n=1 Tax=Hymenobacter rubripertinctus TaxID=2029981 RepID=A0A418R8T9_9BACT|nr:Fic family protein [Hymenobacter rubripertinctus]RIY13903.1 Fic family protein [Hymenobacter rubripertinctus]
MSEQVHTVRVKLDWALLSVISQLDRFDAGWSAIERREGASLKQLKAIATVRSVGASTRIEGSRLSDEEVDVLLRNTDISKLEDRDAQEVVGYFQVLDLVSESYADIDITENSLKGLHNHLLRFSSKDEWHRGNYKQHSNAVEASLPDGTKQLIFQTTAPGFATDDAMRELIAWYHRDQITHPLVKCALFAYDFVSIHPFQDGNGRLSRLLATLLLLRNGYTWIQYVSLEHEIENRKTAYYRELQKCQAQRPGEDVSSWLHFFFDALRNVQQQLLQKLTVQDAATQLSPREKAVLGFIGNHPGSKSGQIAEKLDIPGQSVKRTLAELLSQGRIEKQGKGPATVYYLL